MTPISARCTGAGGSYEAAAAELEPDPDEPDPEEPGPDEVPELEEESPDPDELPESDLPLSGFAEAESDLPASDFADLEPEAEARLSVL
jgi:hypothetical protein